MGCTRAAMATGSTHSDRAARAFTLLSVTVLHGVVLAVLPGCGGATIANEQQPGVAATVPGSGVAGVSAAPRPVGGACAFHYQCWSRLCSASGESDTCGVCLDARSLGEPCHGPLLGCRGSAICRDGICQSERGTVGSPCERGGKGFSFDCDDDLRCVGPRNGSYSGVCVPRPRLGERCARPYETCAGDAHCEQGICVAPRVGASGDSCDERPCDVGLTCRASQGVTSCGAVVVAASSGAACGPRSAIDACADGEVCDSFGPPGAGEPAPSSPDGWVCRRGRGVGEPCTWNLCDPSLRCGRREGETTDVCLPRGGEGVPCGEDQRACKDGFECRAGLCRAACR